MTAYRIEQCCACAGAKDFSISIVTLIFLGFLGPLSARDAKVHVFSRPVHKSTLERFPITWNHVIEKESLKFKELEHVLIEKVEQLVRNMLQMAIGVLHESRRAQVKLRVGYELQYEFPQPTPLIAMLNIHYSRVADLAAPDHIVIVPPVPISCYRDGFGNWCSFLPRRPK